MQKTNACVLAQSCPTVCDLMECSPPGSPVHGVLQARILGWVSISCSKESSQPRDQTMSGQRETDCLPLHHLGKLRRPMKTNDSAQKPSGKEKEFFLIQPFILFSAPLTDWMRSTHTGEGKFLAQLSNSNFNLIQKHPHRHT